MEGKSVGKVEKHQESVAGSRTGASVKELTGRKGARKEKGGKDDRKSKEPGEAGACREKSSVIHLKNKPKMGRTPYSIF